jgi:hypothetical protein
MVLTNNPGIGKKSFSALRHRPAQSGPVKISSPLKVVLPDLSISVAIIDSG